MSWFRGGRKLRIEGGGCADMTRILTFLKEQLITDVLSQVRAEAVGPSCMISSTTVYS